MRDYDEELRHQKVLRQKYFEDPNYRRLSDIVPGGIDGYNYAGWMDDRVFDYLITNQVSKKSKLSILQTHLQDGRQLPINWENFYAYFDEQLNDPENYFVGELIKLNFYDSSHDPLCRRFTVQTMLEQYREKLHHTYDII